MMHHVQGVFPGIALIGDKTVEDAQGDPVMGGRYSKAPATGGLWTNEVFSVRKRPISRSRLTPSSARRSSFKMNQSLKTMEVLLCSALMMAEERQGFSSTGYREILWWGASVLHPSL